MKHSIFLSLLLCALLFAEQGTASTEEQEIVSLKETENETYEISAQFRLQVSSRIIWEVLTDYDHMDEFVSSIKQSQVRKKLPSYLILEQEVVANVLVFVRKMYLLLKVEEDPPKKIFFTDVSHRDFEFYEGFWKIEMAQEGVLVSYRVRAKSVASIPNFIAKGIFRKTARNLLEEVRSEILRRTNL